MRSPIFALQSESAALVPEKFSEPDMSFRPAPFWAVNDRLEPGEVARQFEEMVRSGYSGGFFHSRTGLLTEYLGEEWFAVVEAGVGAAEKTGGHLWLYDEDQWPSGNVGGLVAAMDERYRSATIVAELVPSGLAARPDGDDYPLAAYRVVGRSGAGTVGTERIDLDGALPAQDGERMILRRRYEPKMAWFNGQSPVNLLEPEVTVEFLRRTHEVYKERIGGAGFDCDLGDEGLLADLGQVDGHCLRVGKMAYPVVVVPSSRTWSRPTFDLLKRFVASGGKLVFVGLQPTEIDCEPAGTEWADLAGHCAGSIPCSTPALQAALDRLMPEAIRVRAEDGRPAASTFVHKRRDGDRHMLFVVNTHRERGQSYEVILPESLPGAVTRWDALTGAATPLPAAAAGGTRRIRLDLRPADSALLLIDPAQPGETAAVGTVAPGGEIVIPLAGPWDFRRSEPNVLVIDRLAATADDGKTVFAEDMDHRIRKRLAEHFGVEAALEWQPWMAERSGAFEGKGGPVVLSYRFRAEGKPPASAALVMEWHPNMRVTLNGTVVDFTNATAHWERNFRSVPVAGSIRTGENRIEVAFPYDHRAEIEPVYVTGDFAVRLDGQDPVLAAEAPKLEAGSWVGQGLPFYSGEITCTMPFARPAGHVRLRLRDPRGTLFRFRVNGHDAGKILWAPYELDLTPFLQPGTNRLEVTVVGSRQNTFGPLHDRESDGEGAVASPFHYECESSLREQWSLHDYGLMGGAELVCS